MPDKQRSGVYGNAIKTMAWTTDPHIARWFTNTDPGRTHFDVQQFVESNDTLVSLSREGEGSASPLVTSLTAAVLTAAEQTASMQPDGRLQTPLLGVG